MVKIYGTDMSDSVTAYREEENANLKQQSWEQLIKAPISDLSYGLFKDQLKEIFSE